MKLAVHLPEKAYLRSLPINQESLYDRIKGTTCNAK